MTDRTHCGVGGPCLGWSTGAPESGVLSSSQLGPRTPAKAEKGISYFLEPTQQGLRAWGRGLGKGGKASVGEKFPWVGGGTWPLRASQANPIRRASALHEPKKDGRKGVQSASPRLHGLRRQRPVSPILAIGCPIPDQPCQELSYQPTWDCGKCWGETEPPRPASPPFPSEPPAPGGCSFGWAPGTLPEPGLQRSGPPCHPHLEPWETFRGWL